MPTHQYPILNAQSLSPTRDALHAYARILGDGLKTSRAKRKHWWHASLRPSLTGISTGLVRSAIDFEIELNLRDSVLQCHNANGAQLTQELTGQSPTEINALVRGFTEADGVDDSGIEAEFAGYSREAAGKMGRTIGLISSALESFRSGIAEETSPIQLWPHHFDLSMLWARGRENPRPGPTQRGILGQTNEFWIHIW